MLDDGCLIMGAHQQHCLHIDDGGGDSESRTFITTSPWFFHAGLHLPCWLIYLARFEVQLSSLQYSPP